MDLKLRVWRQEGANAPGRFEDIDATGISPEMSFLEMFDVVNDRLVAEGREATSSQRRLQALRNI